MSKTLIKNEEKVGILPWSEENRLGCIRWTKLAKNDTDNRPTVVFDPPIPQIEFENLEVSPGYKTSLPRFTQSSRFSNPQLISWNLDENNTTSEIDGWKLTVGGPVDEEVVLIATLGEIEWNEIQRFSVFVVKPPPENIEVTFRQLDHLHPGDSPVKFTFIASRGPHRPIISNIIKCQYRINNLPWKDVREGNHRRISKSGNLRCTFEPGEIDIEGSFSLTVQFIADDNNTYQFTEKIEVVDGKVVKSEPIRAAATSDKTKEKIELVDEKVVKSELIRAAATSDKNKEKIELVEEQTAESQPIKTKVVSEIYKGKNVRSELINKAENTNILVAAGSSDNRKKFMQAYVDNSIKHADKLNCFIAKFLKCDPNHVTYAVKSALEKSFQEDENSNEQVLVRCCESGCIRKHLHPFRVFLNKGQRVSKCRDNSHKIIKKNYSSKRTNSNYSKKKNKSPTNNRWRRRWPRSDR